VQSNEYILDAKFNISKSPPFLILREQNKPLEEGQTELKMVETHEYIIDIKVNLTETPPILISSEQSIPLEEEKTESKIVEAHEDILDIQVNETETPPILTSTEQSIPLEEQMPKLTLSQIALKYYYEGLTITRQNGDDIVEKFGYKSGDKLYQLFTKYAVKINRTGDEDSEKKLENKIKLLERVIKILPANKQEKAKEDVSILIKNRRDK
jgi:hypothetical protein